MVHLLAAVIGTIMIVVLLGSIVFWGNATVRLVTGEPLLPSEPRRPVPWGMVDIVAIFVLILAALVGGQVLADRYFDLPADLPPEEFEARHLAVALFSNSLAMLVGCGAAVGVLLLRGASWKDLGVQAGKMLGDVKLGVVTFVMVAPPMYGVQFALTRIWPSEHPVQTLLLGDPQPAIIAGAAFAVVVVAPLSEEIFFRLIFQGWLEKLATLAGKLHRGFYDMSIAGAEQSRCDTRAVFLGDASDRPFNSSVVAVDDENRESPEGIQGKEAAAQLQEFLDNPYTSPHAESRHGHPMALGEVPADPGPPEWPIAVSAAIFALLHWGHGPDPVPLFFLAVGLGYVYHRTHRILPCIVVHFLVNSLSMVALIMYLLSNGETP